MCTSNENDRRVARKNSTVLAAHDNGYDSTSCCISQMPKYGKGRVSTTHSGKTTGPILINLDMQNYTPEATRHANFDFDPETSVVWANASLPLSFFLFFFSLPSPQVALYVRSAPDLHASFCARKFFLEVKTLCH